MTDGDHLLWIFYRETSVLEFGVSQAYHFYWIGGSTNVTSPDPCCIRREDQRIARTDYIPNDSGAFPFLYFVLKISCPLQMNFN